ncbi:MAG: type II toxin-antitoxin system prevent-host-death family antitoxin [Treponema sp.]|jgi:prevent-host-death family protein|nr:type II toxin-antitoxin system prevent-host-death family antitoxin [Treponema sp.]
MKKQRRHISVKKQPKRAAGTFAARPVNVPQTISMHEAKSNLSKLVKRAAAGETIYIGAYGKPEAMLTTANTRKYRAELRAKAFGCMRGEMELPEGWDDPLPDDIIESFYSMKGLEDFEAK